MSCLIAIGKKVREIVGGSDAIHRVEMRLIKRHGDANISPMFIIGLPRSGSTLMYQLLASNFKFSYFSNLANVFYRGPFLVLSIFRRKHIKYTLERFDSEYGYTHGLFSPSEAGSIIREWFSEDRKTDKDVINRTIDAYTKTVNAPFLFKNLNLSFHLDSILEIFPDAFFLLVKRDLRYVSQSIYNATMLGEGIHIDGLTKEVLLEKKEVLQGLATKLKKLETELEEKLYNKSSNYLVVNYSDICKSPHDVLNNVNSLYSKLGFLEKRNRTQPILRFTESKEVHLAQEDWEMLGEIFGYNK